MYHFPFFDLDLLFSGTATAFSATFSTAFSATTFSAAFSAFLAFWGFSVFWGTSSAGMYCLNPGNSYWMPRSLNFSRLCSSCLSNLCTKNAVSSSVLGLFLPSMNSFFQLMNLQACALEQVNGFLSVGGRVCDLRTFPSSRYPFMVSATIVATSGYLNWRKAYPLDLAVFLERATLTARSSPYWVKYDLSCSSRNP